jgi:hypothetical protein
LFIFPHIPHIGNNQIPTDELIFFRGVGEPPTRLSCAGTSPNEPLPGSKDCPREWDVQRRQSQF